MSAKVHIFLRYELFSAFIFHLCPFYENTNADEADLKTIQRWAAGVAAAVVAAGLVRLLRHRGAPVCAPWPALGAGAGFAAIV
jgi:hypothetical protein